MSRPSTGTRVTRRHPHRRHQAPDRIARHSIPSVELIKGTIVEIDEAGRHAHVLKLVPRSARDRWVVVRTTHSGTIDGEAPLYDGPLGPHQARHGIKQIRSDQRFEVTDAAIDAILSSSQTSPGISNETTPRTSSATGSMKCGSVKPRSIPSVTCGTFASR